MEKTKDLLAEVLGISEHVRYVAVYDSDNLSIRQRSDIQNVSSNESDKYEELLVNPTLIKLASQRGNIDCGGLEYFIIRYGNFFVLLTPCKSGHVNIGVEPDQDPFLLIEPLNALLGKYGLDLNR